MGITPTTSRVWIPVSNESGDLRYKCDRGFKKERSQRSADWPHLGPCYQGGRWGAVKRHQAQRAQALSPSNKRAIKNDPWKQKRNKDPWALCPVMTLYLADSNLGGPVGAGMKRNMSQGASYLQPRSLGLAGLGAHGVGNLTCCGQLMSSV